MCNLNEVYLKYMLLLYGRNCVFLAITVVHLCPCFENLMVLRILLRELFFWFSVMLETKHS